MNPKDNKVPFDKESIKNHLDSCIEFWRTSEEDYSEYYVDAYQSVRVSLFRKRLNTDGEAIGNNE